MLKHTSTVRLLDFTLRKSQWKTVIGASEKGSTVSACEAWWSQSKSDQAILRWDEELGQRGSPLLLSAISCPSVMKHYYHDEKKKNLLSFWCVGTRKTHHPSSSEAMTTLAVTIFSSQSGVLVNHLPVLTLQINAHTPVSPCTCSHYPVLETNLELRLEARFHSPAGRVIINNWCQLVSFGALPWACNGELRYAPRKGGFVYKMVW